MGILLLIWSKKCPISCSPVWRIAPPKTPNFEALAPQTRRLRLVRVLPAESGPLCPIKANHALPPGPFRGLIRPKAKILRPRSCLGCLRSALAGKQGSGDLAVCRKTNPPFGRCYKCASGHSCEEIPAPARPPAVRFLAAVAKGDKTAITKWRPVVKGILEIWEEKKEGGGVTVAAISAEEKKKEAKRAVLRFVKVLF
ncbi:hypothetical protein MCOR31_008531 [Pyricularia oryzae]|nr:hypothetical protein MCOR31_008531 [Pyricularia oryzae]KAI6384181.1 hypothetical protein MCOR24_011726 [Pyricularia oryzae]